MIFLAHKAMPTLVGMKVILFLFGLESCDYLSLNLGRDKNQSAYILYSQPSK